jgi:hypothetical protein
MRTRSRVKICIGNLAKTRGGERKIEKQRERKGDEQVELA